MTKITQIKLELAIPSDLDQPTHLANEFRFTVGSQSHHLVFVAVMRETKELCEGGIKNSKRMRKINAVFDFYSIFGTEAKGGAGKITETIH